MTSAKHAAAGRHRRTSRSGKANRPHEMTLMTANQPPRVAAVWRTARRAAAALRAIHDEHALMWDLFWHPAGQARRDRP